MNSANVRVMNPNTNLDHAVKMTKNRRIHSIVEDGIPPPVGAIDAAKRKRASLPWVLVAVFSVLLCVLLSPLKPSTVWPTASLPVTGSVANTFREEIVEKPMVTAGLIGNGRTNDVLWDKYSLVLKGQRIFIQYVPS
jgi:hypothetical protein